MPPRSPDITPMDFFLWEVVKDSVYSRKPHTIDELKDYIHDAFYDLDNDPTLCRRESLDTTNFVPGGFQKSLRKILQTLSVRKVMGTVIWATKGVVLVDFLERGSTTNTERYCETLQKLRRAIHNRGRGKFSSTFFVPIQPIIHSKSWMILIGKCLIICLIAQICHQATTTAFQR
ncbi:hypothetical protein J6590_026588 [Homalodisca vitripennis]|nr:hypothetical protein J6590_026588 [Homalodisca vitripennis]